MKLSQDWFNFRLAPLWTYVCPFTSQALSRE